MFSRSGKYKAAKSRYHLNGSDDGSKATAAFRYPDILVSVDYCLSSRSMACLVMELGKAETASMAFAAEKKVCLPRNCKSRCAR